MPEAECRQLTVLFCDLVDSTALASQLDPEDWRKVVRAYQAACAEVIQRYEGHIAQYLGDGLLVYFGYPQAHENDAQRAVWAGLEMVETVGSLNPRLEQTTSNFPAPVRSEVDRSALTSHVTDVVSPRQDRWSPTRGHPGLDTLGSLTESFSSLRAR
jgi:class 3 adenylate cyclase